MTTPIHEWAPQPEAVTLPSGKTAKLKRPDLVEMISGTGEVPDLLSNLILDMMQSNMGSRQEVSLTRETMPQIMQSMNVIAKACFIEPRLIDGDAVEGDAIPLAWVSFNDKAFVMAWALGGQYEPAQRFPGQSNGRVELVPPESGVRQESE